VDQDPLPSLTQNSLTLRVFTCITVSYALFRYIFFNVVVAVIKDDLCFQ
jgi:hypothetical protein